MSSVSWIICFSFWTSLRCALSFRRSFDRLLQCLWSCVSIHQGWFSVAELSGSQILQMGLNLLSDSWSGVESGLWTCEWPSSVEPADFARTGNSGSCSLSTAIQWTMKSSPRSILAAFATFWHPVEFVLMSASTISLVPRFDCLYDIFWFHSY